MYLVRHMRGTASELGLSVRFLMYLFRCGIFDLPYIVIFFGFFI